MDDSPQNLRRLAALSVKALADHTAGNPNAALPAGPFTMTCRAAVRAVLASPKRMPFGKHDVCVIQDAFMRQKLMPPVTWDVTLGSLNQPVDIRATFDGVLPHGLVVLMRARSIACFSGAFAWSADGNEAGSLECPLCILPVIRACVAAMRGQLWHDGIGPGSWWRGVSEVDAEEDRFYRALQCAEGAQATWAVVTRSVQRGCSGATVVRWRQPAHVVLVKYGLALREAPLGATQQLWVLVATGGKPSVLLRGLRALRAKDAGVAASQATLAAVGLLAGADVGRPTWNPWYYSTPVDQAKFSATYLHAPSERVALVALLLAWPGVSPPCWHGCQSFDPQQVVATREEAWRPARAAWCWAL
jgi:hypothetical protein